jgi:hypothetical protein
MNERIKELAEQCAWERGEGRAMRDDEKLEQQEQEPVAWMMVNKTLTPTARCLYWKPQEDWHITWDSVPLYAAPKPKEPLKEAVYEFFTKYLNRVEYSDSDRPFNPITIGCCRVMMLQPLGDLLNKMRELSGADPNPLEKLQNEN